MRRIVALLDLWSVSQTLVIAKRLIVGRAFAELFYATVKLERLMEYDHPNLLLRLRSSHKQFLADPKIAGRKATQNSTVKEKQMLLNFKQITAIAAVCLVASPVFAQEATSVTVQDATATATLSADGQLTGNVMTANANQIKQVPNAKVSLVSQGKVIDSVTADDNGSFSFANVHPGPYQLVGTAAGMLGSNALTVTPFAKSQPVTPGRIMLQPSAAPQVMYDSYSSAPLASLSSGCNACNACNTCGGGSIGGGFGSGIGSRLGGNLGGGRFLGGGRGGLLSSPRGLLLTGGAVGAIVAISDSSPDN